MTTHEPTAIAPGDETRQGPSLLQAAVVGAFGAGALIIGVLLNWARLVHLLGLPSIELNNPWVITEFNTLRLLCAETGALVALAALLSWRAPATVDRLARMLRSVAAEAVKNRLSVAVCLTALVAVPLVLQLGLYLAGYLTFGADDFTRALRADYWRHHRTFDVGWGGWIGMVGGGWLPFQDYLVGAGLALHRDLYVTPRLVNLAVAAAGVLVAYGLGRELFGRSVGLATAALFAFQPWRIWLGMSGMTSDLPGATLVAVFALYFARWLRTDRLSDLWLAAGALALANGFRYEGWLFTLAFSGVVAVVAALRLGRRTLTTSWASGAAAGLVLANIVPVVWMAASYARLGVWLPELGPVMQYMPVAFAGETSNTGAMISIPLLAFGSFPFEAVLALVGVPLILVADKRRELPLVLFVTVAAFVLLGVIFKWQLAAYLECGRYFIAFAWLLLPFVAAGLGRLARVARPWPHAGFCLAVVVVTALATHHLGRAINYPDMFAKDALGAGWTLRRLQDNGTIRPDAAILIERGPDWGFLAIAALAGQPERFAGLNEAVQYDAKLATLPEDSPARQNVERPDAEGVRGRACEDGFEPAACRDRIVSGQFDLVILSSPERVRSFTRAFRVPVFTIGRYHVFDMKSAFMPRSE